VGQTVVPLFARYGIQWIASDQRVLARSGRWGYQADDPDLLCQTYRAEDEANHESISIFFRATAPSAAIGFQYASYADEKVAAQEFVSRIKTRFAFLVQDPANRVISVILDGENAWGAYRDDGRPFLRALYATLSADPTIRTVTFSEYLAGNPARHVRPHPYAEHTQVYDLFCGSWIDEGGSAPGSIWAPGLASQRRIGAGSCSRGPESLSRRHGTRQPARQRHLPRSMRPRVVTGSGGLAVTMILGQMLTSTTIFARISRASIGS
jgi:alpha-amylase/alpha-mannosidase (GH57 family)